MNDDDFTKVIDDIKNVDKNYSELKIEYMLFGNYLWINNENGIYCGHKNFSLRNLDKLLKMLKKNRIEFTKFEIQ